MEWNCDSSVSNLDITSNIEHDLHSIENLVPNKRCFKIASLNINIAC